MLFAHPEHCHLSCEDVGTVIVPSDSLPEPLKACGETLVVDEPLETVDVVVVVRITVRVVVECTTRGGCLTVTVFPGVVTVFPGVVTVLTRVTDDAGPGVVSVAVRVTTVAITWCRVAATTRVFAFPWPIK